MFKVIIILVICLSQLNSVILAQAATDPRLLPISSPELRKSINATPIQSPKHFELISRSFNASLAKDAYDGYLQRWKTAPKDGNANLLLGMAAQRYMKQIALLHMGAQSKEMLQQSNKLQSSCRAHLAQAVALSPNSATAKVAYGFFLWQYDNKQEQGLKLVQAGLALAPKSAGSHATLGAIYSNDSAKTYDPVKAENEFKTAISLDKNFSYPYEALAWLYVNLKQYQKAQKSFEDFRKLSPPNTMAKGQYQLLESLINKGLN